MHPSERNTFANNPLDRASHRRLDQAWLDAKLRDPTTRILPFRNLDPFLSDGPKKGPAWLRPGAIDVQFGGRGAVIFLGMQNEIAHFAIEYSGGPLEGLGGAFTELRQAVLTGEVTGGDAAIVAQGKALINWHARHGHCAVCGNPTEPGEAGYKRSCQACGAEHFPRTDPVVIMLAYRNDKVLLGRGKNFPGRMFSALAGFIEPGETIEEAVAREVREESGIEIGAVHYHSTQPWPFPMSLMIGCLAEAVSEEITIDEAELAECRWVSREDLRDVIEGKGDGSFFVPPAMAIAHQLMRALIET
jgi:NAD+ diphosphatase